MGNAKKLMDYAGETFDYRRLGDFTYHVLTRPEAIRELLMKGILAEWEVDHREATAENWTVEWMGQLPQMKFSLARIDPAIIRPRTDLMGMPDFRRSLEERADEREQGMLRGVSIEPLLVNQDGLELMDGYTRHSVLQRHPQKQVYVYLGEA